VNTQEYISSGIVESYVLGLASSEEAIEFELMCSEHSEVRAARIAFEMELENRLSLQRVAPPRELKSRIFSQIGMEEVKQEPQVLQSRPALVPRVGFPRFIAAASVILLLGSVMLNLYLLNQYKHSIAQYKELMESQAQLANANHSLNTKMQLFETALYQMKDPRMEIVKMPAIATSPFASSMATVYWDTSSRVVWLLVNQLPMPVSGKQYQLWAIVDGKPVDAGIFDVDEGIPFVKLKTIPRAQAFAITLEKQGGSLTPNMDAMYVRGKVTG
jgi:anti-sigma-K factor RskA